ncbi:membrane protein [Rhodopirellula europaea 6C]|uniref:Membrane protein n=1 Tax=Rhodopirellula europaea 6C TaxID=1263867 RepID=M2A7M8_9BACT|nr:membrane protein [Rhodopirellula europaea 6C]
MRAIGYAIGIYLIGNGYEFALPVPFYGPLIGWAIAVLQNHFGPAIWAYMVNRTRTSTTRPRCL